MNGMRMLKSHTPMSKDAHAYLGQYMETLHQEMQHLGLLLYNNGYRLASIEQVCKGLSTLRSELESCMAADYPDGRGARVYYGQEDGDAAQERMEEMTGLLSHPEAPTT